MVKVLRQVVLGTSKHLVGHSMFNLLLPSHIKWANPLPLHSHRNGMFSLARDVVPSRCSSQSPHVLISLKLTLDLADVHCQVCTSTQLSPNNQHTLSISFHIHITGFSYTHLLWRNRDIPVVVNRPETCTLAFDDFPGCFMYNITEDGRLLCYI